MKKSLRIDDVRGLYTELEVEQQTGERVTAGKAASCSTTMLIGPMRNEASIQIRGIVGHVRGSI